MQLYNTLTRRKEEFVLQTEGEVTLYTCGFTVYAYAHIGNMRAYVAWDTLRRALDTAGYDVKHVMNITDVGHLVSDTDEGEDKLEKGARRSGKSVWEIAEYYTKAFKHDMAALNILPPNGFHDPDANDTYARATKFIDQQQAMIRILLDKDFAYITKQAIYFDVVKMPDYGRLTGQKLSDKEVGVRDEVVTDPDKRSPYDFAVWFFTVGHFADHSMRWPSPWGEGFPGWHLECSAIIHATLGDPVDIHTGGIDLIGTHHVNEMAQTEAAYGHPLARYWLHNEFVLVDGGKMSKSQGNGYTLRDLTECGFAPLAFRLLSLQAHYRSELNFTWESLEAAQHRLLRLYAWADLIHQPEQAIMDPAAVIRLTAGIEDAIEDDLDTPRILANLSEFEDAAPSPDLLHKLDDILGLQLAGRPDIDQSAKDLIAKRETARAAKDWDKADELRTKLAEQGIEVDDTAAGPRWHRTSI